MLDLDLTVLELAQARYGSYQLLSRLFLEGISAELRPYLDALPDITIPTDDLDSLAAEHQSLFRFQLLPHEAIFLDTSGLLGGPQSERVTRLYQQNGYRVANADDHIGHQLGYLAFLLGAEVDALEDGRSDIVPLLHQRQRDFLGQHLLRWLPPLTIALARQPNRFYADLGALVWSLASSHASHLAVSSAAPFLPDPPTLLGEDATSLKAIANFLATPAVSGWWFGQREMAAIGRNLDLPRGFGGRIQTMMTLFRSASQFDAAVDLFDLLRQQLAAWQADYAQLYANTEAGGTAAALPFIALWQARLTQSEATISAMREQVIAVFANS